MATSTVDNRSSATPRPRRRMPRWLQPVLGVVGAFVLLELIVRAGIIPGRYFPPPTETLGTLVEQMSEPAYWTAVLDTLAGWGLGLLLATVVAVPLGMLIGSNEVIYRGLRPIVEFLRPVPAVALIPLAILIWGSGLTSKVFLAAFASAWPLLIQAMYGVRELDPAQREAARSYRIRPWDTLVHVTLPGAVPFIATGLRIACATSLILVVSAELIIGAPGLGREIALAQAGGVADLMYALIVTTGLVGWVLNMIFLWGERRVLRWHPSQREISR